MSNTKTQHRVFALIMAVVFLGTAVASGIAVVWQIANSGKQDSSQAEGALTKTKSMEDQLAGTKLTGFTPVAKIDTLQSTDIQEGTGAVAGEGSTVVAHYTGAVAATGVIFQSSYDNGEAVEFGLGQVIEGWQKGVPGMKVGGKRRLLIPASMAYGATPPSGSGIPANADLVFDIELTGLK